MTASTDPDPNSVSQAATSEAPSSASSRSSASDQNDDESFQSRWDNQPPTNTDESAVEPYELPPLMQTSQGISVESTEGWERLRRPEIMERLTQFQFGRTPTAPIVVNYNVLERGVESLGGKARRTQARIEFPAEDDLRIRVLVLTPADADGPVPAMLHLSFMPAIMNLDEPGIDEDLAWSGELEAQVPDREAFKLSPFEIERFIDRGYGVVLVYYGDIYPDFDHGNAEGVTRLFGGDGNPRTREEWGGIGAWAWGLSRVMDYLENDPDIDAERVALSGISRLGKSVLWASAQDKRFALTVPWLSGEGGAALSRRNYGETIADLTNPERYHYWFAPRYQEFAFNVDALPVDAHMLLAMLAPRPTLLITGSEDTWSDPMGEWLALKAAQPAWELYGRSVPEETELPAPDQPIISDLAYVMHDGGHTTKPIDYEVILDFMDTHLK